MGFSEINNIEERGRPVMHCGYHYQDICYRLTRTGRFLELEADETWTDVKGLENIKVYDFIIFNLEDRETIMVAVGRFGI